MSACYFLVNRFVDYFVHLLKIFRGPAVWGLHGVPQTAGHSQRCPSPIPHPLADLSLPYTTKLTNMVF